MTRPKGRSTAFDRTIVGHITDHELRRHLSQTELANGFANRFLWARSTRSKHLPEGGSLTDAERTSLANAVRPAVEFGRAAGLIQRDDKAKKMWADVYPDLSEGQDGLVGVVTSRAEAQVLRLSLVYALLDCSNKIQPAHLEAALAVWEYCQRTAEWIFSDLSGNSIADKIYSALRTRPEGMTASDLMDYFSRHISGDDLRQALKQLEAAGHISVTERKTKGRSARVWTANFFQQDENEGKGEAESSSRTLLNPGVGPERPHCDVE